MIEPNLEKYAPENAPYWDATKKGTLLFKRCMECGKPHYYPRARCPHCSSEPTQWQRSTGRGSIYSFSIVRRAASPYVIAYVTLSEGFTMLANVVDCEFGDLRIGQLVTVVFEGCEDGRMIPQFTPLIATSAAETT